MADVTTTAAKTPTLQEQLKKHETESQAGINKAYDDSLAAQKQSLLDAYNANAAGLTTAGETVRQNSRVLNNDLKTQAARNQGNLNQFADVRQVNRQPGSQAALGLNMANAAGVGAFGYTAQLALQENERQRDLAATQYQGQVQAAIADNDYKRAAALLDDYNNQNTWRENQAKIIATYGNFDAYKDLYGDASADNMRNVWIRQNPDVAYSTGQISAGTYRSITGSWPPGYTPPWYGGGGGWYGPAPDDDGDGGGGGGKRYTDPGSDGYGNNRQIYVPARATPYTTKNAAGFSGGGGRVR